MAAVLLLSLTLLASPLGATTVQRFALEDLARNAERIVVGICTESASELVRGQIYTRYLIDVSESIKGPTTARLELHLPGGHFQGVFTRIAGMPIFAPGDEMVLFLTGENELGHAWPVGLAQGRFSIERKPASAARVYQALDGITFYEQSVASKKARRAPPIQGVPLDQFLSRIRALEATGAGEAKYAP